MATDPTNLGFIYIVTLSNLSFICLTCVSSFSDDSVSADIKLETETEDGGVGEDVPSNLSPNTYHPRRALRNAISEWLHEFKKPRAVWGPIAKPQVVAAATAAVPLPIIPSVNTCMSITSTTTSCSAGGIAPSQPPLVVNANQLHALAEVCSTVSTIVLFLSVRFKLYYLFHVQFNNFQI